MTNPLLNRLSSKEDNFVERKPEGAASTEFRRTLVAFANSVPEGRTAVLFIGVTDSGEIRGLGNSDKLQKTIRDLCERDCYPPIRYTSEVLPVQGKDVLAVEIGPSTNRPHFAGPAYIRRGSESVAASEQEFNDLITSRLSKAGQLLALRGQLISVKASRKELGSSKHISDSQYLAHHECQIEECTPSYVRLYDIGQSVRLSEPLENITISYDEERHRPMLIVSPH